MRMSAATNKEEGYLCGPGGQVQRGARQDGAGVHGRLQAPALGGPAADDERLDAAVPVVVPTPVPAEREQA